jgi:hypothetical protein
MANSMNLPADAGSRPSPLSRFLGGSSAISRLARLTGFQRREPRKITPSVFLHAFVHAALQPTGSIRGIAIRAGLAAGETISRQALWKRIQRGTHDFLSACLARVLAGIPETTGAALACLPQGIGRVLVADSTLMALHPSLAEYFPGASNQSGVRQASARVQAVLDLTTGRFLDFQIGSFRDNDQKAASWTARLVRAGDLILRDLGYFTFGSLRTIAARGAYFITRLRLDTALFHPGGTPLDLLAELRTTSGDLLEMPVLAGAGEKLPVRLVAVRLDPQQAAERRRKAKADRDKRLKWSARRAELLGWSITLDNLPPEVSAERVYPIYALRWRVEVVFKSWKTCLGMCRALQGRPGAEQARALLCAAMIGAALTASAHAWLKQCKPTTTPGGSECAELSLLKTTPLIAELLRGRLLPAAADPMAIMRQIAYHCRYDKRRKQQNFEQALNAAFSFKPA